MWAGSRYQEFEQRLAGRELRGYRQGRRRHRLDRDRDPRRERGRTADARHERAAQLVAEGVTTIEIKSGYGLDLDNELKILRVARAVGERLSVNVRTTLLAAHALPPEFKAAATTI